MDNTATGNLCREFFNGIKSGDADKVFQLITKEKSSYLINTENEQGKSALQVALEIRHYDIAKLMIENGVRLNTTLLRMIEINDQTAIEFICEHRDLLQEYGQNIMDCPADNNEYTVETTPILLAAEKNNYQIVKILLKYEVQTPDFDELKSKYQNLSKPQLAQITYRYCNAITSEAYLLQTRGNLVTAIFIMFKHLRRVKKEHKGMNDELSTLTENLQRISRNVLDLTRNKEEVRCLLSGDQAKVSSKCISLSEHNRIPPVIRDALLLDLKGFLTHNKCQAALTDLWYHDFPIDIGQSKLKRCAVSLFLTAIYPLLCVLYMIFPCGPIRRFMKIPYVKFTVRTASRLSFLCLLIYTTMEMTVTAEDQFSDPNSLNNVTDDNIRKGYLLFRYAVWSKVGQIGIFVWILGMTVREARDALRMGYKMYLKIGCSVSEFIQLVLYWIYIIMMLVNTFETYQTVYQEGFVEEIRYGSRAQDASTTDIGTTPFGLQIVDMTAPPINSNAVDVDYEDSYSSSDSWFSNPKPNKNGEVLIGGTGNIMAPSLMLTYNGNTRNDWASYDILLIAEGAFALANVLTFGCLFQTVVMISSRLGVLHVSLTGMVGDIIKFLILFSMTWLSFALGMTQLYRPFNELKLHECKQSAFDPTQCEIPAFISLIESMKTLFWALFGMNEMDNLNLETELHFTSTLGHLMYALYLLVAVTVLLNALVAMMSDTYAKVQTNAETEWKYCRTKQMTEYILGDTVLPPPFNLVPDIWSIVYYLRSNRKKFLDEAKPIRDVPDLFKETNRAITERYIYDLQRRCKEDNI